MAKDLNTVQAVAHSPSFNKLSGELRNRIWRYAISEEDFVNIDSNGVAEPALLTVCRLVRREAGSLYYSETKFRIVCANYDSTALMLSKRKIKKFKVPRERGKHFRIDTLGTPDWSNLLVWLRRIHTARLSCPTLQPAEGDIVAVAMHACFRSAYLMREIPWCKVEALLDCQRAVLVKIDPPWGIESDVEG